MTYPITSLEALVRQQNPYGEIIDFVGLSDDDVQLLSAESGVTESDVRTTVIGTAASQTSTESIYYSNGAAAAKVRAELDKEVQSHGKSGLWWRFGQPEAPGRHIAKAMRVPYKIEVVNDQGVIETRIEHVLIGFEGWITHHGPQQQV